VTGRRVWALGLALSVALLGIFFFESESSSPPATAEVAFSTHNAQRAPAAETLAPTEATQFETSGWAPVVVPAPDNARLLAEPNASSDSQVAALHTLLQSAIFESADLETLAHIARTTSQNKTRYLAIEAIARAADARAEAILIGLFEDLDDPTYSQETRSQILSSIEPSDASSSGSRFLLTLFFRADLPDSLKEQALQALVAVSISDESAIEVLVQQLPQTWAERFILATRAIRGQS